MKKIVVFSFIFCIFLSISVVANAEIATPLVVWTQTDALYIWQNDETRIIPLEGKFNPLLSPSAEQVMLMPVIDEFPQYFLTMRLDGTHMQRFDIPYPNQVLWQSDTVLWANSYAPLPEGSATRLEMTNLLYRIQTETGQIDQWQMDSPFVISINSSGDTMVLSHSGEYQQTDGVLRLLSLTDHDAQPVDVLHFPAVSFGSHMGYFPVAQWITDAMFRVAIPAPDALYAQGDDMPPTMLWQVTVDGNSQQIGQITSNLFSPFVWSMDGERLSYIHRIDDGSYDLVVASASGEAITRYHIEQPFGYILPIPNQSAFLQWDIIGHRVLTYDDSTSPQTWITASEGQMGIQRVSQWGIVFVQVFDNVHFTLAYARFGDNTVYEIVKLSEIPFIDAKWNEK